MTAVQNLELLKWIGVIWVLTLYIDFLFVVSRIPSTTYKNIFIVLIVDRLRIDKNKEGAFLTGALGWQMNV
jgi:hypothetical protein